MAIFEGRVDLFHDCAITIKQLIQPHSRNEIGSAIHIVAGKLRAYALFMRKAFKQPFTLVTYSKFMPEFEMRVYVTHRFDL